MGARPNMDSGWGRCDMGPQHPLLGPLAHVLCWFSPFSKDGKERFFLVYFDSIRFLKKTEKYEKGCFPDSRTKHQNNGVVWEIP
jgi:hypothetical protein